ncbi:UDP-glucose 4-epimerase GalE [Pseudactinotalea terrae]|uniref:UDP-glucose 4-epimerase GalE n=1 Tax=Pseudactinotalea terrae TaxID=1743262 RepID=UPI0012E1C246|nr:UDP-glucose 4-epimerase GalE [Pseudactinotalea terrae]
MKVLITGGAGYIGSTIGLACQDKGWDVVVLDDLSTGRREFTEGTTLYEGDIADHALVARIFAEHPDIEATVHCAAKIVVPESVADPIGYYRNNVSKTIELLDSLRRAGCTRLLFSSSASIYEPEPDLTVNETSALNPQSPYAASKMLCERIMADVAAATDLRTLSLRYFNPVGGDPDLRTGLQNPKPSHALGKLVDAYTYGDVFTITGVDWATRDGSAIRDYIHVWDLAKAHVAALEHFDAVCTPEEPYTVINIGTGTGSTVRELVAAFTEVVGEGNLNVVEGPPRPGDVIGCYTTSGLALEKLGWKAELSIADAIRTALEWAKIRPERLGA